MLMQSDWCAGVEENRRLHLHHAAEDCQTSGGDSGPQESKPPARGQPFFF